MSDDPRAAALAAALRALARCAPDLRGALEKSFAVARRLGLPAVASWRP